MILKAKYIKFDRTAFVVSMLSVASIASYGFFINPEGVGSVLKAILPGQSTVSTVEPSADIKPSAFAEVIKPIHFEPYKISINSLGLNVNIISIGVDPDGALETPKNWMEAGWYHGSAKAGEVGNSLINAHYDDNLGRPAAFWQLKNLGVGDTVDIEDKFGKLFSYKVTELFYVDIQDPERLKVLEAESDKPVITLITCGGVWLPGEHTYNKRLVVKGELIS